MSQREPVPTWVKATMAVVILVTVAVVFLMLMSGEHGPGRHTSAPAGAASPMLSATADGEPSR